MPHALIIERHRRIAQAIHSRLVEMGFTSFEFSADEEQAVWCARRHSPDLVVVGDELDCGSSLSAARRICAEQPVAILLATASAERIGQARAACTSIEGPFALDQIERAVSMAVT